MNKLSIILFVFLIYSCVRENKKTDLIPTDNKIEIKAESHTGNVDLLLGYDTILWVEITEDHPGILLDLRYATTNNFVSQQLYPCPRCFLNRTIGQKALTLAEELQESAGYLVLFDCYRPLSVQKKLWDIKPDKRYVTPPSKGSMHNKGLALDASIADQDKKLLNMGTPFDYFGKEAWPIIPHQNEEVNLNRKKLSDLMNKYGFNSITTEWWHFSSNISNAKIYDWQWQCY